MSWIPTSLVTGLQGIFNGSGVSHSQRLENALEDIREAMLNVLGVSSAVDATKLELKVTYASDLNDLWYLRGDIMAAIAAVDGEALARQKLCEISDMFSGLLPKSLTSRPRHLGD